MSAGTRRRLVPRLRLAGSRAAGGPRLRVPIPRASRRPRRGPRPRRRLPRLRPRLLGAILLVVAVLVGAFFWMRQSSLVAVQRVRVTGVSGPDAVAIRQTLVRTAERMTTMTMSVQRLRAAVARYPVVRSLRVSTHLPHTATITVFEQVPVGVLDGTTVSARGTLLRDVNPSRTLPRITAASGPTTPSAAGGAAVTGTARADIYLLASAPYPIISRLATAGWKPGRGLTVAVRNGPVIYFGNDTRLVEKWRSVIRVLADPSSAGASYIDVTDPTRPAAGIGADTQSTEPSSSSSALTGTTSPSTGTTPGSTGTTPQSTATTGVPGG